MTEPRPRPRPKQLLQVQTTFRHGSRTPMGFFGVGKDLTNFTEEEQNLSIFEPILCNFNIFFPVSGKPFDINKVPRNYTGESQVPLPGGGLHGALTQVGMQQALLLGSELGDRYVGTLLPKSWSEARRSLVLPLSPVSKSTSKLFLHRAQLKTFMSVSWK